MIISSFFSYGSEDVFKLQSNQNPCDTGYQTISKPSIKNKSSFFIVFLMLLGLKSRRCNVVDFLSSQFSLSVRSLSACFTMESGFDFFENSVTLSLSSFFSQSTVLIQCSSPKSFYSDLSIWTLSRVFFFSFSFAKSASFLVSKVVSNTFSKRSLRKTSYGFFFLYCSFIFLNYFYNLFNSFLNDKVQNNIKMLICFWTFQLLLSSTHSFQLVHVEDLYLPDCQHLLFEGRKKRNKNGE